MCDLDGCSSQHADLPLPEVTDRERRNFLKGLVALPLAAVLAYPDLAKAAAMKTESVSIPTPSGGKAMGVLAMPAKTPAPCVVLIHEWWGLNDQIKAVAAEFAEQGYMALAIDLYGGGVGTTREEAMALMKAVDGAKATEELVAAIGWLRGHGASNGKVGTIGWCFGGGWSLNASIATPVDATVIYYGSVVKTADQLAPLNSPVLGHFGKLDKRINMKMVGGFEKAMAEAGKKDLSVHWYDADHAFANPTGSRYDAEDAALSWRRTMEFLGRHLS